MRTKIVLGGLLALSISLVCQAENAMVKFEKSLTAKAGSGGRVILFYKNLTTGKVKYHFNGEKVFSTASNFKWYVLFSLAKKISSGALKWDDQVRIRAEWLSMYQSALGYRQLAANGVSVSLRELAYYMIKFSDNTATDHIIRHLGREQVFSDMKTVNTYAQKNWPFFTTSEAWKIKATYKSPIKVNTPQGQETVVFGKIFSSGTQQDKLRYLKILNTNLSIEFAEQAIRNGNRKLGIDRWDSESRLINDVEWYSDASSLCNVIHKVYKLAIDEKGNDLYRIMSAFRPSSYHAGDLYEFGAKSGNEAGVVTMSYFFRKNKNSDLMCIIGAVNNPVSDRPLNTGESVWTSFRKIFNILVTQ